MKVAQLFRFTSTVKITFDYRQLSPDSDWFDSLYLWLPSCPILLSVIIRAVKHIYCLRKIN